MSSDYARISITIPQELLAAADQLAAAQDRSRSWIIAEAVRRYAAAVDAVSGGAEPLGVSRQVQIGRDLQLSAAQRVHEADAFLTVGDRPMAPIEEPRHFATYAEFARWRASRGVS